MGQQNVVKLDLPADNPSCVVSDTQVAKAFDGRIGIRFLEDNEKWQEYVFSNADVCDLINKLERLADRT